jgi:hypothetical protein
MVFQNYQQESSLSTGLPLHAMEVLGACGVMRYSSYTYLTLQLDKGEVVQVMLQQQGNNPCYPLNRSLGGLQSQSGHKG